MAYGLLRQRVRVAGWLVLLMVAAIRRNRANLFTFF
jgi:hypothetical protein